MNASKNTIDTVAASTVKLGKGKGSKADNKGKGKGNKPGKPDTADASTSTTDDTAAGDDEPAATTTDTADASADVQLTDDTVKPASVTLAKPTVPNAFGALAAALGGLGFTPDGNDTDTSDTTVKPVSADVQPDTTVKPGTDTSADTDADARRAAAVAALSSAAIVDAIHRSHPSHRPMIDAIRASLGDTVTPTGATASDVVLTSLRATAPTVVERAIVSLLPAAAVKPPSDSDVLSQLATGAGALAVSIRAQRACGVADPTIASVVRAVYPTRWTDTVARMTRSAARAVGAVPRTGPTAATGERTTWTRADAPPADALPRAIPPHELDAIVASYDPVPTGSGPELLLSMVRACVARGGCTVDDTGATLVLTLADAVAARVPLGWTVAARCNAAWNGNAGGGSAGKAVLAIGGHVQRSPVTRGGPTMHTSAGPSRLMLDVIVRIPRSTRDSATKPTFRHAIDVVIAGAAAASADTVKPDTADASAATP